uniref:Uncharacterized protein n=1 Tax=Chrysemys picta bellii TaxID=8478 RepID=A0A8C3HKF4_CHRPI
LMVFSAAWRLIAGIWGIFCLALLRTVGILAANSESEQNEHGGMLLLDWRNH